MILLPCAIYSFLSFYYFPFFPLFMVCYLFAGKKGTKGEKVSFDQAAVNNLVSWTGQKAMRER